MGRRVSMPAAATVLDAARQAGLGLLSVCGGAGLCDSCRIRVIRGDVSPVSPHERDTLAAGDLAAGYRLACQAKTLGDTVVDVPAESVGTEQRLQIESDLPALEWPDGEDSLDASVRAIDVEVPAPNLADLRSDVTRLRDACRAQTDRPVGAMPAAVLADLPRALRDQQWKARLALGGDRLVAVLSPNAALLGLAVDIGTTKIAVYLVDLQSGRTIASEGVLNPQVTYGEDVISRIAYADRTAGGAGTLHAVLVRALNDSAARLCATAGVSVRAIVDAVLVGNTVMHHLACGLPVAGLGRAPYVSVVSEALTLPARDVGLDIAPGAQVYLPPNLAGYVGADHVAALGAVGLPAPGRTRAVIDIGTNTEISILAADRIVSCSCASGPAFEGAHIGCGMRATAGAIERVRVIGGAVRCQTIGGTPPVGMCGSGVLDAVAALAAHGALDRHGAFRRDHPLIDSRGKDAVLVLASADASGQNHEIVLTRHDVTEIQLAKAAIRTGVDLLLAHAGLCAAALDEVVVAGAFGSYIDLASARLIRMLPDLPADRFRQVGNAAGAGARQMLVSASRRRAAERLAARVEYIDLTSDSRFTEVFAGALGF